MEHIEAAQPETPFQPTVVHHFLAAVPGTWKPINVTSNAPVPLTLEDVHNLTGFAAQATSMDPAHLVWFGSSVLENETYQDPADQDEAPQPVRQMGRPRLITPPKGLIVPGQ